MSNWVNLSTWLPFGGTDMSSFLSLVTGDAEHAARYEKYRTLFQAYTGSPMFFGQPMMSLPGFVQENINLLRSITNLHINFLSKCGFDIVIPDDPETKENEAVEKNFVKFALDKQWEYNSKLVTLNEMSRMGAVTGDVFLYFYWKEDDPLYPDGYVKVDVLPSQYVFPVNKAPYGPLSTEGKGVLIVTPEYNNLPQNTLSPYNAIPVARNALNIRWRGEYWTAEKRTVFGSRGERQVEYDNPFGEIPIVHIPNIPVPGQFYGESDVELIGGLQASIDDRCSIIAKIIDYHGGPTTVYSGVNKNEYNMNKFEKSLEGSEVILLPDSDNRVQQLTLDPKTIESAMNYVLFLKTSMFEITHTPSNALGQDESSSNAAAAAAQAMRYLPMTSKLELKQATYGRGLQLANRMILRILELKGKSEFYKKFKKLPDSSKYYTEIVFGSPFPRDKATQLSNAKAELDMDLTTRKRVLESLGHGRDDAQAIIDERIQERANDIKAGIVPDPQLKQKMPGKEPSGNKNPTRPNPDDQGEKRSKAAEESEH